jgi:hypothetical protein
MTAAASVSITPDEKAQAPAPIDGKTLAELSAQLALASTAPPMVAAPLLPESLMDGNMLADLSAQLTLAMASLPGGVAQVPPVPLLELASTDALDDAMEFEADNETTTPEENEWQCSGTDCGFTNYRFEPSTGRDRRRYNRYSGEEICQHIPCGRSISSIV